MTVETDQLRLQKLDKASGCLLDTSHFRGIESKLRSIPLARRNVEGLREVKNARDVIESLITFIKEDFEIKDPDIDKPPGFDITGIEDILPLVDSFIQQLEIFVEAPPISEEGTIAGVESANISIKIRERSNDLKVENAFRLTQCIVGKKAFEPIITVAALKKFGDNLALDDPLCRTGRSLGREGVSRGGAARLGRKMSLKKDVFEEFLECFEQGRRER